MNEMERSSENVNNAELEKCTKETALEDENVVSIVEDTENCLKDLKLDDEAVPKETSETEAKSETEQISNENSNTGSSSEPKMKSPEESRVSRNLEEIDKTLEKLHELAEDVYLATSFHSDQSRVFETIFENSNASLKKCETIPVDMDTHQFDEEDILDEVQEAVRDAEEKQLEANHMALCIDTEYSSDEESSSRRYKNYVHSSQGSPSNTIDEGGPSSSKSTSNKYRISSNATLQEIALSMSKHERARSNDSRSTSLFSSSMTSFRRPMSHFSIDNSCFELDAPEQRSLMCTPVEKIYVKNSRSAPEMRINDVKINPFLSSPSPSNDATTTTSEPSVSSEFSADQSASPVVVTNLRLRLNEGLRETASPVPSPVLKPKKKKESIMDARKIKLSLSSPNMKAQHLALQSQPDDVDTLMSCYSLDEQRLEEKRTIEIINVRISNLNLRRRVKKDLCILTKLDVTDVHRSPKIEASPDSLVHEFSIETTDYFSKLHIIFLEGSKSKVARPVGKVTLPRKLIANAKQKTQNCSLTAVSKYPDFTGQICVDFRKRPGFFSIRVIDYDGLKLKENQTLVLLVSVLGESCEVAKLGIDIEEKRSKEWLEMPCGDGMLSLKLTLWQDLIKGLNTVFHGQIRVDVDESWASGPAKWFYLRPKTRYQDELDENAEDIGDVTVTVSHQVEHVLRIQVYRPLLDLLTTSADVQPITASLIAVIEALPKVELSQMSRALVELMAQTEQIRPVLISLYNNNILKCQDENTLFRGQSLAGKMLFEMLTNFGKMYLITTLKPVIDKIFKEHKNCEIDPARILINSSLEKNKSNVLVYFQMLFQRVTQSSPNCPHFVKQLLHDLRTVVAKQTGRPETQRLAVSSFVIMRFFAAAILNPRAFEIRKDQPDLRVSRTLLLLSKLLQRVSNVTVSQGPLSSKEAWLSDVFEMVTSDHHKLEMSAFLDKMSLSGEFPEPVKCTVFKFGNLQQIDKGRVAWRKILQYKKRYVQLTDSQIIWHKDFDKLSGPPKGALKLSDIRSVNVDNKHKISIITEASQLQFEAQCAVEANDWMMAIEKQRNRMNHVESGTTSESYLFDMERHADKIHNVLYKYWDTMSEWANMLKSDEPLDEKTAPELLVANYVPQADREQHKKTLIETLTSTIEVTENIQKVRNEYEAEHKRKQKIEEAPIEQPKPTK